MQDKTPRSRPGRHVKIAVAVQYGGECRASLYKTASKHPGLFKKNGRSTVVDLDVYDRILDARPAAVLKERQS